jgi:hypothetical protein
MRTIFTFLIAFLLLESIYGQAFQDTIPFRNDLGLIIIPITFNGVEKQFAFDTGAEHTVAYGWAKKTLQKTKKVITITSSSGLKSKMRFYQSGKIELGSRKVTGHQILHASENEFFSCHQIDGILGVDIIKQLNWKIDYKNNRLIMYPSSYFPEETNALHKLDFEFRSNRPYVYLKRKKNRFRFLLDTGAGGYSDLSKRNYNLTNLNDFEQVRLHSGSIDINGILTGSQPKMLQLPEMTSGDARLFPVVSYNNQKSTKIGNQLWKDQTLFLSLKKNRLYLYSEKIAQDYARYDCSVMFRKGTMRITSIVIDSEPWNQGIRQGDEVIRVDGKVFSDFCSLDRYQRKVMNTGKPITFEMKSGQKISVSQKQHFIK